MTARLTMITRFLLAASLFAQQKPAISDLSSEIQAMGQRRGELAKQWLQSPDALHNAWGAAIARQDNLKELAPFLLDRVAAYQPSGWPYHDKDLHDAMTVALDTLIELDVSIPEQQAYDLHVEFPQQSLILLIGSQDDTRFPILLDLLRTVKPGEEWLAAGNILVQHPPPGFVAELLSKFTKHLQVTVVDSLSGLGGGSGGVMCGDGGADYRPNWPAVGIYTLTQSSGDARYKSVMLAPGDTSIYYRRSQSHVYNIPGHCEMGSQRDAARAQYLAKMMDTDTKGILNAYPYATIHWNNPDDYREQLSAAIERQKDDYRGIVNQFVALAKFLTPEEVATLKPRVEIVIYDGRQNRSTPLPTLEGDVQTIFSPRFTPPLQ